MMRGSRSLPAVLALAFALVAPTSALHAPMMIQPVRPPRLLPRMQLDEAVEKVVFEPQGDPVQGVLLLGCIVIPFGYWWLITVPEARLALAKDKRLQDGDTNQYLQELAADDAPRPVERWFFSKWLNQLRPARTPPRAASVEASEAAVATTADDSDEAAPPPPRDVTLGELFTPASLKGNATPQFFSGDNPIVVTVGTLLATGVFATVARENTALAMDGLVLAAGLVFGATRLTLK